MPNFLVASGNTERFRVRVADCTLEHAESVLEQLKLDVSCPSDLTLYEVADPYDDPPPPPAQRSRLRRLLRRG